MDVVTLLVGRSIPRLEAAIGGLFRRLSLILTKPNRKSFTSVGENKCVSFALKKRARTGISNGKSKSVALILLASVPPSEACTPPAPHGSRVSALEKKNRAAILSAFP